MCCMRCNMPRFSLLLNSKAAKLRELRDTNAAYLEELTRLKPAQHDEPGADAPLELEVLFLYVCV